MTETVVERRKEVEIQIRILTRRLIKLRKDMLKDFKYYRLESRALEGKILRIAKLLNVDWQGGQGDG